MRLFMSCILHRGETIQLNGPPTGTNDIQLKWLSANPDLPKLSMLLTAIVFKPIGRAFLQEVSWNTIAQSPTLCSGRYSCTVFMLYFFLY